MTHQLTDISTVKKRLDIEIPQEVVDQEITRIAREISRRARVPGFRPGRAPLGVVKTRYRDDILSETCQQLLPRYFGEATKEEGLEVVDAPEFDDIDHGRDRPLRFSATFEVFPTLNITNHTGIPVEAVATEVTDQEVEDTIQRLVEEHSEMVPVEEDRPIAHGDFAEITFSGSLQNDAVEANSGEDTLKGEKALCEIGGATTVDEFTDNLTGARVGEDRVFDVHYKADHPDERLAGKTARYTVHIESLKTKHRPKVDDEFSQSVGDYQSVEELRAAIRKDLESHKLEHATQQKRDALLQWLVDNNEFEVPEILVEHQLRTRIDRLIQDLYRRGVNPRGLDIDWVKIRENQYENAVRDVRGSLILSHLAAREGIVASEDDVSAEIARIAEGMGQPPERVREVLGREGGIERVRDQIRNNKVLDLLEEKARIVESSAASSVEKQQA